MKTIAYVDGFNLYYQLLKRHPEARWLNVEALIRMYLDPVSDLIEIRYYTAKIDAKINPTAPVDQQSYLNALRSTPIVKPTFGKFLTTRAWMRLVHPPEIRPRDADSVMTPPYPAMVRVFKNEEKGSDVNLGVHLVQDAYLDRFEQAIIVTNDTDLLEPMRIVTQDIGKPLGLFTPANKPSEKLKSQASFVRHMTPADARKCQFPDRVEFGRKGKVTVRPNDWCIRKD